VKPVRVGVVGVGYLGQFHAEKYAKIESAELVGVVDIEPTRAAEIAHRYGTRPFLSPSELLDRIQAVSIAVPTPLHHGIAREFLLHGIDVLVEKPLCCTLEEADELIEISRSTGLILQVGHVERFNSALLSLGDGIKNPAYIESRRLAPFSPRATEVDVVLDLMIHDIDVALSWIASGVKSLHAFGIPLLTPRLDLANARIEFENGCVANLTASRVSPEKVRTTSLFDSDRLLSIDYLLQKASVFERNDGITGMRRREIPVERTDSLEAELRSFLLSVSSRKPPRVTGTDGRRALEMALRITRTAEEQHKGR
jgi:predicted dehydrogenase